ncbi:MAG TPA: hypothetical protein VLU43_16960 [Anaeromyxobacteraceae bacterium]|nr:hypothetical protein [Anaeromyxobacteraceae bacterium]
MARRKTTKEKHLSVRLAGSDLAALERAADAAKLSVATYVRQKALQAAERDDPEARRRRTADLIRRMRALPSFDRGGDE